MKIAPALLAALLSAGCYTTKIDIRPAERPTSAENSIVVERSRAELWAKGIPALASRFFVINNLDQTSGLVNVSYAGSPVRYVEGPILTYSVMQGAGSPQRSTTFLGTQDKVDYVYAQGERAAIVHRAMKLEGRANIVLEELGPAKTRVTANVKYVLTQSKSFEPVGRWIPPPPVSATIDFNSGGSGSFTDHPDATYYASGALEAELLDAFR